MPAENRLPVHKERVQSPEITATMRFPGQRTFRRCPFRVGAQSVPKRPRRGRGVRRRSRTLLQDSARGRGGIPSKSCPHPTHALGFRERNLSMGPRTRKVIRRWCPSEPDGRHVLARPHRRRARRLEERAGGPGWRPCGWRLAPSAPSLCRAAVGSTLRSEPKSPLFASFLHVICGAGKTLCTCGEPVETDACCP